MLVLALCRSHWINSLQITINAAKFFNEQAINTIRNVVRWFYMYNTISSEKTDTFQNKMSEICKMRSNMILPLNWLHPMISGKKFATSGELLFEQRQP